MAIGNFMDTTNGAYFQNSVSFVDLSYQNDPNHLIQGADLVFYKYAGSHTGDTTVNLYKDGELTPISQVSVNNLDYQFDEVRFSLSPDILQAGG